METSLSKFRTSVINSTFLSWKEVEIYLELFDTVFLTSLTTKLSIDCFKAGATVGFKAVNFESNGGLSNPLGLTGSGIFSSGSSSTTWGAVFSGSIGLTFECFDSWQPFMFKNSVKSTLFLLQQDQPL